ncbi:alpha/beta hydrolase [Marinobacter sp.]|uniref:alpha/beta hydrolase n=1 Tax=Marinobacter sp. TaxID=50741 RepID=UPI0019BAE050|nr:alpha/beta hydrolase [Marinobacter sp.]MBC7193374.1 alpha/beta hydrolase [Marinobacter sp.]
MADGSARLFLKLQRITMATGLALLLGGCSGMFFYPDRATYITPDRLNLAYEDISLQSPDGETLHGWWLPAVQTPAKGTVYFLHGNAQNISSHILNVAWLPDKGYNVFALDYRGYGRSTGVSTLEGTLSDTETGLRWLASQPARLGGKPLFILGQSLGGGLAIPVAAEWTQRNRQPPLDGVILDATFSGFRAITREKLDGFWLTWPLQIPLSWTIPDDYEGVDHIARISPVPVMVIHSVRDGLIPFHHGLRLYEAADEPKTLMRTDTGHGGTFVLPEFKEGLLEFMEGNDDLPRKPRKDAE